METVLENIIGAVEALWFKLATLLNLEEVESINSLQPILANILSDPLQLGLAIAILTLIPYSIHKIKSTYTEKEKRLDALLKELDDDSEEVVTDSSLLQNQQANNSSSNQPTSQLAGEGYGDEFESASTQKKETPQEDANKTPQEIFKNRSILDKDFGWESSDDEWSELYDYISKPFQTDKPKKEGESTTVPQESEITATVSQEPETTASAPEVISQSPQEIFKNRRIADDDFGWETSVEEWSELYDYISKPFQIDKPTAVPSDNEALPESKEDTTALPAQKDEIIASIGHSTVAPTEEPSDIGVNEIVDQIIEKTFSEEESAKEPSNVDIDELATLIKDETVLDVETTNEIFSKKEETIESTDEQTEETSNIGLDELATLMGEEELDLSKNSPLANTSNVIETTKELLVHETPPVPIPQRVELTLEEVEPELEPKVVLQTAITESLEPEAITPSAGPLLNSMLNSSVSAKTDALVSKLKTFQAGLETRFQSLGDEHEKTAEVDSAENLRKKQGNYQPASVSYQSKRKSRSNKEYLRQLESFIFMARQKSNKNTEV
jgi:hypothetical protein